ncbi:hypothetical protein [Galbibacter mesophilus]|uniref:hypothetical protein n=1 Tax=Galbibacter mesophilus TaxID=379069 RepID=UPI00191DF437|nr:hypothetical protein [Galbibacter mesophilus]MCM5662232.1 hypothetical protein [Galbibacter mesophilus]
MKYKGALLLLLGILFSCEIDFEDNTRLYFESTVVDQSGVPVSGIPFEIGVSSRVIYFTDSEIVGTGESTKTGKIAFPFLKPLSELPFTVSINNYSRLPKDANVEANYGGVLLADIPQDMIQNYALRLDPIQINKLTSFQLQLNRNTQNLDTLNWSVTYSNPNIVVDFSEGVGPYYQEQVSIGGLFLPSDEQESINIRIPESSLVVFKYKIRNEQVLDSATTEIEIEKQDKTYEFSY